jgi:hypothetical protein
MPDSPVRGRYEPPSGKTIAVSSIGALVAAGIVLVAFVLPAEYGIDPTGAGRLLGIAGMSGGATKTVSIADNLGGNETLREAEVPAFGEPTPLPNPNVYQPESAPAKHATMQVKLDVDAETEVKAVLGKNQVMTYDWQVDDGIVYSDFHGHTPEFGPEFFVRYQEDQDGTSSQSGSLVAPFAGEHGWYWLNLSDHPVTITLNVTGFFDEMIDYGELE